jgi:hypothetical protein
LKDEQNWIKAIEILNRSFAWEAEKDFVALLRNWFEAWENDYEVKLRLNDSEWELNDSEVERSSEWENDSQSF